MQKGDWRGVVYVCCIDGRTEIRSMRFHTREVEVDAWGHYTRCPGPIDNSCAQYINDSNEVRICI